MYDLCRERSEWEAVFLWGILLFKSEKSNGKNWNRKLASAKTASQRHSRSFCQDEMSRSKLICIIYSAMG